MKFSKFLVKEIRRLQNKLDIKILRWYAVDKELSKRLYQLKRLTYFLDFAHYTYRTPVTRMKILERGQKGLNKCKYCENYVKTFGPKTCSIKCGKQLFNLYGDKTKLKEGIKSATKSRNYKEIIEKRVKTMKEDIDSNGLNACKRASIKAAETMKNTINDKGESICDIRSKNTVKTMGKEGIKRRNKKISRTKKNKKYKFKWFILNKKSYSLNSLYFQKQVNRIISLNDKDAYNLYFRKTSFKHGFKFTCYTTKKEKALLKKYGVYNNVSNHKGCVRDHLLSRRYGFNHNVPIWIISHPANCEIILHSENTRRKNTNDDLISLDKLLKRIENYK